MNFKNIALKTKIIFLVFCVIISALFVTNYLTSRSIESTTIVNIEKKTRDVSRTVALSPVVVGGLNGEIDNVYLQEHIEQIRQATEVLFIVVLDLDRIRKTHPLKEQIGKKFVGGDEELVFQGKESISIAEGSLGYSLRYFTPVYNDTGVQIGAVVAGLLLEDVERAVTENRAMLHYAREGIVAIDIDKKITLINSEGVRLFKKISNHNSIGRNRGGLTTMGN